MDVQRTRLLEGLVQQVLFLITSRGWSEEETDSKTVQQPRRVGAGTFALVSGAFFEWLADAASHPAVFDTHVLPALAVLELLHLSTPHDDDVRRPAHSIARSLGVCSVTLNSSDLSCAPWTRGPVAPYG